MSAVPATRPAASSPFAHLASGRTKTAAEVEADRVAAAKAEEDDQKKKDDEAKKKADEEEAAKKAEEDERKKKDEDAKKGKKSEDGDDDTDRDDDAEPDARAARARERGRVRAILLSEPGKLNPAAAAHLATGTSMSRRQAIEMLSAMQAGATPAAGGPRDQLRDRMNNAPNPDVGAGGPDGSGATLADRIVLAGKKRRGEA